jgi:hypothetical protein
MIDTNTLIETLVAKHKATAALVAAFPGGIHVEIAPAGTSGTYLVIEAPSGGITHAYGTGSSGNPLVLFKAVGLQRGATAAALKLWTDLLDNPATAISGSYSLSRIGVATGIHIGPNEASNANDLWQWAAAYEFNTN